jgi:hypothetical protein
MTDIPWEEGTGREMTDGGDQAQRRESRPCRLCIVIKKWRTRPVCHENSVSFRPKWQVQSWVFVKNCCLERTRTGGAQSRVAKQTRHGPESHLSICNVLSTPRTQNPHHRLIGRRFDFCVEVLIPICLCPPGKTDEQTNINNPFSALLIARLCPPARRRTNTSIPTRPLPPGPGHHPHRFDEGLDIVYRNNPRQPSRWENHGQSFPSSRPPLEHRGHRPPQTDS